MIVDAHHHFWDITAAEYPWMTDELAAIRHSYGPDDLRPLLAEHGVDRTVLVQTRSSVDETREFLEIADTCEFVGGVVGWVDLTAPDVADVLASLEGKLVGVRHQVHDEPSADWLLREDVRRGLRAVSDAGLAYDLLVRTREAPIAFDVAASMPDARFVIDHIAKPPIASGEIDDWAAALEPFGALGNVWIKLSGLVTEADWETWSVDDLRPYVDRVLNWFGELRCLYGSDWPVCLLAASYGEVLDALHALTGPSERIYGTNAAAVYGMSM